MGKAQEEHEKHTYQIATNFQTNLSNIVPVQGRQSTYEYFHKDTPTR